MPGCVCSGIEMVAVCSEIHMNTLCGQNMELLNVKLVVHIVTTEMERVKSVIEPVGKCCIGK